MKFILRNLINTIAVLCAVISAITGVLGVVFVFGKDIFQLLTMRLLILTERWEE